MTTRKITLTGFGIALYVALALCLQVPVFENYYLCFGYIAMAVYCCCLGPVSGAIVGSLGVVLYCLLTSGLRGMPGWALGNVVIGLALGAACRMSEGMKNTPLRTVLLMTIVLISTAAGMLGVKSLVEHLLYAQPMVVRMAKNVYAFVSDVIVLWVGLLICPTLAPALRKLFPELCR